MKDRVVIASNNSAMMNYASVITLKSRILCRKNGVAEHLIPPHRNNDSCTEFFKILKILPLSAQYSLLMFVVNNRNLFLDNVELYIIKTRNSYNLHPPLSHLNKYQKGVLYVGIKIFNHLPTSIKSKANETK